jgi:hypothetical protein
MPAKTVASRMKIRRDQRSYGNHQYVPEVFDKWYCVPMGLNTPSLILSGTIAPKIYASNCIEHTQQVNQSEPRSRRSSAPRHASIISLALPWSSTRPAYSCCHLILHKIHYDHHPSTSSHHHTSTGSPNIIFLLLNMLAVFELAGRNAPLERLIRSGLR